MLGEGETEGGRGREASSGGGQQHSKDSLFTQTFTVLASPKAVSPCHSRSMPQTSSGSQDKQTPQSSHLRQESTSPAPPPPPAPRRKCLSIFHWPELCHMPFPDPSINQVHPIIRVFLIPEITRVTLFFTLLGKIALFLLPTPSSSSSPFSLIKTYYGQKLHMHS